jgi:Spy/CpxP family protein refolding chaperone
MKRIVLAVAVILVATLGLTIAVAQPMPRGGEMKAHIDAAANYLNLTAAQRASWDAAIADIDASSTAFMTKNHAIQRQLHDALEAASPDACAIGNLAIQSHAAMDQAKTAHEALIAKLASYLTPDQKTKFEAYVAASMAEHREGPPPMH